MAENINNLCDTLRLQEEIQKYFILSSTECPYGLPYKAVYNQALFDAVPDPLMGTYLSQGFRRNGNIIYNMECRECRACVPLRIDPEMFKANRTQKRTLSKNQDVSARITPLTCSQENLDLLEKFLAKRYPGRDNQAIEYYNGFFLNHITNSVEISYRIGSKLLGVSIVDLSTTWLNVVFFYFDPSEERRSPGTYNILYLIDFCRQKEIKFIYLGYWIKDVQQMSYKANFKPHYILSNNSWELVER